MLRKEVRLTLLFRVFALLSGLRMCLFIDWTT